MVTLRSGSIDMDDAVRSRGGRRGVMMGGVGPGVGGPMVVGGGGIGIGGPGGVGLMGVGGGGGPDVDLMSLVALNPNTSSARPPSTTSVSSSTGSGAPRTTTTSRRGGRTRARSPVVSGGGRMSTNNTGNGPDAVMAVGAAATQQQQQQQQGVVVVSDNPSSAAAAAAAAAKAFSNNSGNNNNNNNNNMNNNNNSMMSHMNINNNSNAPGGRGGGQWPHQQDHHGDRNNGGFRNNNINPSSLSNGYGPPSSSRKWPGGDDGRVGGGGPSIHPHGGGGMPSIMGGHGGGGGTHHSAAAGRYGGGGGAYDGYPGDRQHGGGGGGPQPGPYGSDGRGGVGGDRRYRDVRPSTYDADMRGPIPLGGLRGGGGGGPQRYPPPGGGDYGYPPHSSNREPLQQQQHQRHLQQQQQQQQAHSARSSPSPKNSHRGSPVGGRNNGGNNNNNSNSSISSGGASGTTMVIGGTKPIHVPKTDPLPTPAERPVRASGIFRRGGGGGGGSTDGGSDSKKSKSRGRGSPGSNNRGTSTPTTSGAGGGSSSAAGNDRASVLLDNDEDSPQKILLSLRTPTSSFEEKKESDGGGGGGPKTTGLTLSPDDDDPPLMSATQQRAVELFERTPEQNRNIAPIDNNPSFVLFNSSFDSFGGDYFNVEASLQTDSFGGMVRTASIADNDATTQILHSSLSNGNISTAQMLAPSASGQLTIGYSPVNSFGNVSTAAAAVPLRTGSHGGGNTMLLGGGPEVLSPTAPPQVLGIYRSYSGAGPNGPRPLDDSHLRMSVGSFGAQSMSYGVGGGGGGGRPFGDNNTITVNTNNNSSGPYNSNNNGSYYGLGPTRSLDDVGDRMPAFYVFLRKYKTAFKDCSFLLPGLKAALLETPKDGAPETTHYRPHPIYGDPTPHDLSVSRRRVQCSVCAFGGNHNHDRPNQTPDEKGSSATTIFRGQQGMQSSQESATVTPSSSTGSPPRASFTSRQRMKYEEELPGRYYENESRLSWEFEDNPPVEVTRDEDSTSGKSGHGGFGSSNSKDDKDKSGDQFCRPLGDDPSGKRLNSSSPQQPKMRYRCKLCGQPKQNHTCPYQQSLARSIGIMVYPAVNAFTAAEPGSIAPPLSEMNNFVDLKDLSSVSESSPGRPTPERMRPSSTAPLPSAKQVTPESARSSPRLTAPSTPPGRPQNRRHVHGRRNGSSRSGKKRSHNSMNGTDDQGDLLFVEPMELLAQQFLTVTTSKALSAPDAYSYPALPLPYAQRKRLSDNLFSLSNEVPKLTDECAQVLREAREKDMWDLAVAELMTQVIVVIHCRDGDHRFEGLRQYLLTLGIAC